MNFVMLERLAELTMRLKSLKIWKGLPSPSLAASTMECFVVEATMKSILWWSLY